MRCPDRVRTHFWTGFTLTLPSPTGRERGRPLCGSGSIGRSLPLIAEPQIDQSRSQCDRILSISWFKLSLTLLRFGRCPRLRFRTLFWGTLHGGRRHRRFVVCAFHCDLVRRLPALASYSRMPGRSTLRLAMPLRFHLRLKCASERSFCTFRGTLRCIRTEISPTAR